MMTKERKFCNDMKCSFYFLQPATILWLFDAAGVGRGLLELDGRTGSRSSMASLHGLLLFIQQQFLFGIPFRIRSFLICIHSSKEGSVGEVALRGFFVYHSDSSIYITLHGSMDGSFFSSFGSFLLKPCFGLYLVYICNDWNGLVWDWEYGVLAWKWVGRQSGLGFWGLLVVGFICIVWCFGITASKEGI